MAGQFESNIRNAWCDCIRGYAIILVCLGHLMHMEPIQAHVWSWLMTFFNADIGVFVFYVLSGFLVTGLLAREVEDGRNPGLRSRAIGSFFARRLFRLQPSYLLFLALYALLCVKQDALSWWVLFFPLSNWFAGPYITWHIKTLHVEETYYLLIGACSVWLRHTFRPLLWTLLICAPVGRFVFFIVGKLGYPIGFWLFDRYLPLEAFAMGGLLALHLDRVRNSSVAAAVTRKPVLGFGVAITALVLIAAGRDLKPFSYALLFTWPLLYSGCSVVMLLSGLEQVRFVLAPEWLRRLGVVSYTVYLFQQFVLGPWDESFGVPFSWPAWAFALVSIAVVLPLWYMFVEKPLTNLGSRLFPRTARRVFLLDDREKLSSALATSPVEIRA